MNSILTLSTGLLLASYALPFHAPTGQEPGQETSQLAEWTESVTGAGALLKANYVFPDVADACDAELRKLAAEGRFSSIESAETLAEALTTELQRVSQDQHLLVRLRKQLSAIEPEGERHPAISQAHRRERGQQQNFGFERVERLDGNVGYLDIRYFAAPNVALDTAAAAMEFLAGTDALIFDLRQNGGGSPGMVHFLCSYLFDRPTHLNSFYFREGDRTEDYWTLPGVPGEQRPDVPVYVLTSSSTFSGAEEFSYNMRTQGRGTVVGETTRGGANPGQLFPIGADLEIFIPTGRAINPITGTNWEGVGVTPHVPVDAEQALETAHGLARDAAASYRAKREARWTSLEDAYAKAIRLDKKGLPVAAAAVLKKGLGRAQTHGLLGERQLAELGRSLLNEGRAELAVAALTLATEADPESAPAWAQLGAGQRATGANDLALESYGRALRLDPAGPSSDEIRAIVDELQQKPKQNQLRR